MSKKVIVENITYIVGKSPENAWRRDNLLRNKHVTEDKKFFQVMFGYTTHVGDTIINTRLTYNIIK